MIKTVSRLVCDSCGAMHPTEAGSAMEKRIAAGIDGWGYRAGRGTSREERLRQTLDWCSACSEDLALAARKAVRQGDEQ